MLFNVVRDDSKIYPYSISIRVGQNAHFTCMSNKEVVWKYNGHDLPHNVVTGKNGHSSIYWLNIIHALKNNAGKFQCFGESEYYLDFEAEATLNILGRFRHWRILVNK